MNYELGITNGGTCRSVLKGEDPSFIRHSSFAIPRFSRAFTIVELLMVVGIISVLVTITFSAVSGSMKRARTQKARALCMLVEQGVATYYAQKGEWPVSGLADKDPDSNSDVYTLSATEVREMVKKVVEETRKNNPMIDVSGLFVSTSSGEMGSRGYGMDFMTAIHGSKRNAKKIKLAQMYFGYPCPGTGYFRRFKMTYSPATDKVTVSTLK